MDIRHQNLTVEVTGDTATVTITFIVILLQQDMDLPGGFIERVYLAGPSTVNFPTSPQRALWLPNAIKVSNDAAAWELPRKHVFHVPRYPEGRFKTTKFYGHIEIRPAMAWHNIKDTNWGVLPGKYNPMSDLTEVGRIVVGRVRRLLGILTGR